MTDDIKEDSLINEYLQSIGPWNNCIVIGGGYALIIYKLYFTNNNGISPIGTRDIDSLISRNASAISEKDIAEHLLEAGYTKNYKDFGNPATESYIKEINSIEVEIEFLTDDSTRKDKNKNITIAGVSAQQLTYLQMSIINTIIFNTYSGTLGKVVSPGAWIFHKGLTFPKRNNRNKKYKDLYGIWYAGTQLGEFSQLAINELIDLSTKNTQWFKTFCTNLKEWLQNANPNDWITLENQDPYGTLKKEAFIEIVKVLINKEKK